MEMTQDPDTRQEGGEVERADLRSLRGVGRKLPGLKLWRVRSGLTQRELAEMVGVPLHYVQRAEQGRRGCNPEVARKMADVLEVDLQELRAAPDEGEIAAAVEEARVDSGGKPPQPHLGSPRYPHQAYLKVILNREVGSAYSVLDERAFETMRRAWEPSEEGHERLTKAMRELL